MVPELRQLSGSISTELNRLKRTIRSRSSSATLMLYATLYAGASFNCHHRIPLLFVFTISIYLFQSYAVPA